MTNLNTKEQNNEICSKLYNSDLITFDKYLECTGQTESIRSPNISDKHKYATTNQEITKSNIYNQHINIFSTYTKEPLYLAVIKSTKPTSLNNNSGNTNNNNTDSKNNNGNDNNLLTLTSGIIEQDNNIFIIEKIDVSKIAIKHQSTGKYVMYNIPELSFSLSDNKSIKTNFIMKTFLVNGILKYKFILLKQGGVESDYSLIIKNGKLAMERDSTFTWDIINLEFTDIPEVDFLLNDINTIESNYNNALYNYNLLFNKKRAIEDVVKLILTNANNVFVNLIRLKSKNEIKISFAQLKSSQQDTFNLLKQNELSIINNKVKEIKNQLELAKTDLEMYKNQMNDKINELEEQLIVKQAELTANNNKIQKYNRTLMNNNIILDINKFNNANDENAKNILKSEINKNISNMFNNKKTRVNLFYVIIISILLLIIIIQIGVKLFNIKSSSGAN